MTFMLFPKIPINSFDFGEKLLKKRVPRGHYTMMHEHTVFRENYIKKYMANETRFIGVVREPLSRLMSQMNFRKSRFSKALDIEPDAVNLTIAFIKKIDRFDFKATNEMSYFYGYGNKNNSIAEYLSYLNEVLDHVVVYEKMDESLLILKRKLGWNLVDIMIFAMRQKEYERTIKLKKGLEKRFAKFCHPDIMLYKYFLTKLKQEIGEQRNDFAGELEVFRSLKLVVTDFCSSMCSLISEIPHNDSQYRNKTRSLLSVSISFSANRWEPEFKFSGYDCLRMKFNPNVYRKSQQIKQDNKFCKSYSEDPYCSDMLVDNIPWNQVTEKAFLSPCMT